MKLNTLILDYSNSSKSANYGWLEQLELANRVAEEQNNTTRFNLQLLTTEQVLAMPETHWDIILIGPSLVIHSPSNPDLSCWLVKQSKKQSLIASACAGGFILAETGLLDGKKATTHWRLANEFKMFFPKVKLEIDSLIVPEGNLITAGGITAWLDLGLVIVERFMSASIRRELGKILVMDTTSRQQSFYQKFIPNLQHQDQSIKLIQQSLNENLQQFSNWHELAMQHAMSLRNLQRRFKKATGYSPHQYLQRLRVQSACDLLESTHSSFESITEQIGLLDISAFRKVFIQIMGLSPSAFRQRFLE